MVTMATGAQAAGRAAGHGHHGHGHRGCFAMVTMAMAIGVANRAAVAMAPCVRYPGASPCVGEHGSNGHMVTPFFLAPDLHVAAGAVAILLYILQSIFQI